jgi:hypothetical protein
MQDACDQKAQQQIGGHLADHVQKRQQVFIHYHNAKINILVINFHAHARRILISPLPGL